MHSVEEGSPVCLAKADENNNIVGKSCSSDTTVALIRATEKADYLIRNEVNGQCLSQGGQANNIRLQFNGCPIGRRNYDIKVKLDEAGGVKSLRLISQSTMTQFDSKCITVKGNTVSAEECRDDDLQQEFRVIKVPSKYDAEIMFFAMHDMQNGRYPKGPIALSRPFEWAWQQNNKLKVCMIVEHPEAQTREWRDTLTRWVTTGMHSFYETFLYYKDWPYQTLPEIEIVGWQTPHTFEPGEDLDGKETSCPDTCRRIKIEQAQRRISVPEDYKDCEWENHTHFDFFAKFKDVDPSYKAGGTGGDWGITISQAFIRAGVNSEPTTTVVHEFGHTNQSPDYYNLDRVDQPLSTNGQGFRKPTAFDHARMRQWYRLRRPDFPEKLPE